MEEMMKKEITEFLSTWGVPEAKTDLVELLNEAFNRGYNAGNIETVIKDEDGCTIRRGEC